MPITLPNLDDRTYDDLLEEALTLIPVHSPEWTNHNDSDPGITLVQLFAYLSEMLIYRLNRVSDANVCSFLKLIDGVKRSPSADTPGTVVRLPGTKDETIIRLVDEVRNVVQSLRTQDRAITAMDFEVLARKASPEQVARAHCLTGRSLDAKNPDVNRAAHVSVIIVPSAGAEPTDELIKVVSDYLDDRRLLTTQVHVVGPNYVGIAVHVTLYLKGDAVQKDVYDRATQSLQEFLDPLRGGQGKTGWPFGRSVYVSEIYALLDRLPGVDHVGRAIDTQTGKPLMDKKNQPYSELTAVPADTGRVISSPTGTMEGVRLDAHELVTFVAAESHIQVMDPKIDISRPLIANLKKGGEGQDG